MSNSTTTTKGNQGTALEIAPAVKETLRLALEYISTMHARLDDTEYDWYTTSVLPVLEAIKRGEAPDVEAVNNALRRELEADTSGLAILYKAPGENILRETTRLSGVPKGADWWECWSEAEKDNVIEGLVKAHMRERGEQESPTSTWKLYCELVKATEPHYLADGDGADRARVVMDALAPKVESAQK